MWMQRDFDLNSMQFADSKEEVIKQTMVKQDMAFRNQVHELHRLYGVQKSLMKDLGGKDDDWYNPWDKAQSFVSTFRNKFDPLVKECISFSANKANSSSYIGPELLNRYHGTCSRIQKRPLNLQLSADEFIETDEDNLPKREKFVNFLKVAEDSGHLISVVNPSGAEDLNLSLRIGVDKTIAGGSPGNCFNKKVCTSPPIVIDLEDSVDNASDASSPLPSGYVTPQSNSKGKLDCSLISNTVNVSLCHQNTRNSSCQESTVCYQGHRDKGTKVFSNDVSHANISTKVKQPLFRAYELDLNRVQIDESSHSDDPILTSLSTDCSSGNRVGNNDNLKKGGLPNPSNWQDETRGIFPAEKVATPAAEIFVSHYGSINSLGSACNRAKGSEASLKIPDSMSLPLLGSSESHSRCDDDTNAKVDPNINVHNSLSPSSDHVSPVTTPREGSYEGSVAENTIFSCIDQDELGIKSPASVKSYSVSDNNSTNANTEHCGMKSGVCNKFSETVSGTQISDVLSGEHDIRNSNQAQSKSESGKNKSDICQVDVLMEIAAESLLQMYSEKASGQDLHAKMLPNEEENEERQETMCSIDSYELTVLKLTEESDCDSAISNAYQVHYEETKDFSLKLRRGRRMKNFQREILPGLASLARHEICEDITIMEGALRSREYKKMSTKRAASGQNWSTPVRSRRSRLSYVRRRIFA